MKFRLYCVRPFSVAKMSAILKAWEPNLGFDPSSANFDQAVAAYQGRSDPPTEVVKAFVRSLLSRYPDITDAEDTIWSDGPLIQNATGGFISVSVALARLAEGRAFFFHTARAHGLDAYDPQEDVYQAAGAADAAVPVWVLATMSLVAAAGVAVALKPELLSRRGLLGLFRQ